MMSEIYPLTLTRALSESTRNLNLFFTVLCVVDLFGVFPVVVLPRAIIDCGWFGIPFALVVFSIQIFTALLLGHCWMIGENLQKDLLEKSRYPYTALAEIAYGKKFSKYVTFVLTMSLLGASIPHFIVASQNLQIIGSQISIGTANISYCYWVLIVGLFLCPLFWLGSPKDMKCIAVTSVTTVVLASILSWICLTENQLENPITPPTSWNAFAVAFGILAFQFDVHPMILTIQMDMRDRKKIGIATILAFIITGGLFLVTTVLGFMTHGRALDYNILRGLPPSSILYATLSLVTIQVGLSTIVGITPLFQQLEHFFGVPPDLCLKRCFIRTSVVGLCLAVSETIPRIDLIMGLVGGCFTGQLVFIFPVIIYWRLRALQAQARVRARIRSSVSFLRPTKDTHTLYGSIPKQEGLVEEKAIVFNIPPNDAQSAEDYTNLPTLTARPLAGVEPSLIDLIAFRQIPLHSPLSLREKLSSTFLIFIGLVATLLATVYSLTDLVLYEDLSTPCVLEIASDIWSIFTPRQ